MHVIGFDDVGYLTTTADCCCRSRRPHELARVLASWPGCTHVLLHVFVCICRLVRVVVVPCRALRQPAQLFCLFLRVVLASRIVVVAVDGVFTTVAVANWYVRLAVVAPRCCLLPAARLVLSVSFIECCNRNSTQHMPLL